MFFWFSLYFNSFSDRIYALKAFGKKLIRKYIDEKYVNPRIEQEVSISENLKNLASNFLLVIVISF